MGISVLSENDKLYVKLSGEIDHHAVKELRREVDEVIMKTRPKSLMLDLSAIDFMDSSGLGFVLGRLKKMNETDGELFVVDPEYNALRMLQLAGADKLVKIVYSENGERK